MTIEDKTEHDGLVSRPSIPYAVIPWSLLVKRGKQELEMPFVTPLIRLIFQETIMLVSNDLASCCIPCLFFIFSFIPTWLELHWGGLGIWAFEREVL